jgi:hypothetical protein
MHSENNFPGVPGKKTFTMKSSHILMHGFMAVLGRSPSVNRSPLTAGAF